MFETSLDILYITLAASVALLTVFLIWGIYYVVRILKNAVYMVEKFTVVMKKADEVLDLAKEKLHSTGTYLGVAVNLAKGAMEYFGESGMLPKPKKKRTTRRKK